MATDVRLPIRILLLTIAYTLVGRMGLMLEPVGGFATVVWPPSGIALAALVHFGLKLWPGVALGALIVNLWTGAPLPVALGIMTGNTLEAVLGAWALSRIPGFNPSLERLKDVIGFVVLAACLTTIISATIGATSLELGGVIRPEAFRDVWQAWWVGDMIGDLAVAPLILTWTTKRSDDTPVRTSEALALGTALVGGCLFVFGPWSHERLEWIRRANLLIPLLMWAAIRFGPRGATAAAFVYSATALWGTVAGHGPFVGLGTLRDTVVSLQLYLPLIAATFLALAAVTAERSKLLRRERAARREAERAVQARDDFLAVAAHELATPLTPLQLELENLHRAFDGGALTPGIQRRIDRASRQTLRLARLTERLLDVSRLAGGHLRLERSDFDFAEVVGEVVDEFRAEAARAGSALVLAAPAPVIGHWDRLRASQVVSNLLSNAVKYGGGQPIALEVNGTEEDVVLRVIDHGTGIDAESLSRIFDRFERAAPERRRGGLGLGLYIAREIVQAHGGQILVESSPGEGSTFTVSMPRRPPLAHPRGTEPTDQAPTGGRRTTPANGARRWGRGFRTT